MASNKYGLLFESDWCIGCHSCEVSCQIEHGFPVGQSGVFMYEVGPYNITNKGDYRDDWQYSYTLGFTKQCDLCQERQSFGHEPTCVQHCQSGCLYFGTLEELSARLCENPMLTLYTFKEDFS